MRDKLPQGPVIASFAMPRVHRILVLAGLPFFAVIAMVVMSAHPGPPWPFMLLWWMVFACNAYWYSVRLSYKVQVTAQTLRWSAPLRSGEIPLSRVRRIRPQRFGSPVHMVEVEGERPVLVLSRRGIVEFGQELKALAPHVDVRIVRRRWAEPRWIGSGFRRGA